MRPGDSQGGGFSAAPLEPASYQFSCRDKKIAPGGTSAEIFMEWMITRTGFHTEFFALIRLALAGDARATFPGGEGFGMRIATPVTSVTGSQ